MARKRKLDAGDVTQPTEGVATQEGASMGGMWGGTATNMLKQRLQETRESIAEGVINGTVALELMPRQVLDQTGTDRLGNWKDDPEFDTLVANIQRRGQMQPIRVRPLQADWKPQADYPLQSGETFVIQSGRRRLAACELLGIKVKAVVSTEAGDQALADLEERFHENTMRKNLSGFEELVSIGLLAEAMSDLTQEEISARLGVAQGDVSLGRACVELHAQIVAQVDVVTTPKRAFRSIIPKIRAGEQAALPSASGPKPVEVQRSKDKVTVKVASGGMSVSIKTQRDVDPKWLADKIADLLSQGTVQ